MADGSYLYTLTSDFFQELDPNGGRINMGAYGGASEATVYDPCLGDFDGDCDVNDLDLAVFAADFARTDCETGEECEDNFDGDNDVDGSDLAVFAANFGRTDCPCCQ